MKSVMAAILAAGFRMKEKLTEEEMEENLQALQQQEQALVRPPLAVPPLEQAQP